MSRLACLARLSAVTVALSACNATSEGEEGNVLFTPRDCGRLSCDFEDSIGVGGVVHVQIEGNDGVSTAGVDLASDDEGVLQVRAIGDIAGAPAWELVGVSAGVAGLEAIDRDGAVLDELEVGVQTVSGLTLQNVLGDAVGPSVEGGVEVWQINADEAVSFQVTPTIGDGVPTMGRFAYDAGPIDEPIIQGLVQDDISEGYLYFEVPAGEYSASFQDGEGNALDVTFVAE